VGEFTKYEIDSWQTDRAITTYLLPLDTVGLVANKGNLGPKHHVYTINYYSSIDQGYSIFISGLY
jgi:dUTPase